MIFVDSTKFELTKEVHKYNKGMSNLSKNSPDRSKVFDILCKLFNDKCAYCETKLQNQGTIEHYRPKRGAMNLHGKSFPIYYKWLELKWFNLLLSCHKCNVTKSTRFPIEGKLCKIGTVDEKQLALEKPYILNPCIDNPEEHLMFDEFGICKGTTERGRITVEVLNLNRYDLVYKRASVWKSTLRQLYNLTIESDSKLEETIKEIKSIVNPGIEYLAVANQCIKDFIKSLEDQRNRGKTFHKTKIDKRSNKISKTKFRTTNKLQKSYSVETNDAGGTVAYFTSAKKIERIDIKNFRIIEELILEFPQPISSSEPWLVFLGENGVGKSSILQAIALTLMGEEHANSLGLDASRYVRRQSKDNEGYVRIHLTNVGVIELSFQKDSKKFTVSPKDPKVLVLGYGATRLLPHEAKQDSSIQKIIRILNLFDPTAPLSDTQSWLYDSRKVNDDQFKEITDSLISLLMLPPNSRFTRDSKRVKVEINEVKNPLYDLSDGYQSLVALIGDIAIGISGKWDSLKLAEGVILLDEIESHLHPSWKISIVERLKKAFPKMTFIVTTHDPLCLKGLAPEEIVVLKRDSNGGIFAEKDVPPMTHLTYDELLTSFLFDIQSTRDSVTAPMIARYSMLLAKSNKNETEEKEFIELKSSLTEKLNSTITPIQKRVEEALKKVLNESLKIDGTDMLTLDSEVRRQVSEIFGGNK